MDMCIHVHEKLVCYRHVYPCHVFPCIYLGGEECGQASDAGEEEEMEEEREADPAEGEHPASPEEELNDQVGGGG